MFSQEQRFLQFFCQSTLATVVRVLWLNSKYVVVYVPLQSRINENSVFTCTDFISHMIMNNSVYECNIHMFKLQFIITVPNINMPC